MFFLNSEVSSNRHPKHKTEDVLVVAIIFCCGLASAFIPILYVLTGYDPSKYILEIFITSPLYRSFTTMCFTVALRFLATFITGAEIFRSTGYMCAVGMVIIGKAKTVLTVLFSCYKYSIYFRYYQCARCVYEILKPQIQFVTYFVLSSVFWMLVLLNNICVIYSPSIIPALMYWNFVGFFFTILLAVFIMLSKICSILESALEIVAFYTLWTRSSYKIKRTKGRKMDYLQALSVRPIRHQYGFFGYMGSEFLVDYFGSLSLRCFDTLIVVQEIFIA